MYAGGAVFKLTPLVGFCKSAACFWKVNDLHAFGSGTDGRVMGYGDVIWDKQGNIYGTTEGGGAFDFGTVYELTPSENGYAETILYSFSRPYGGESPFGGLVIDNKGNLLGTTLGGGSNGVGTVFELSYVPGVGWTEQVLYDFPNFGDGRYPFAGLLFDSAGNLYGTTIGFGSGGGGTVFELSPSGDTWTFKLLYSLPGGGNCGPSAPLTMDSSGNLYGTSMCNGKYNQGNVFKLTHTQNTWSYTSLHDFTGGTDGGGQVFSNVSIDVDGTLYGTASGGGDMNCYNGYGYGCGVVWMIKP
jgi:uncharacterized repeat protein (TIGR03803 family)